MFLTRAFTKSLHKRPPTRWQGSNRGKGSAFNISTEFHKRYQHNTTVNSPCNYEFQKRFLNRLDNERSYGKWLALFAAGITSGGYLLYTYREPETDQQYTNMAYLVPQLNIILSQVQQSFVQKSLLKAFLLISESSDGVQRLIADPRTLENLSTIVLSSNDMEKNTLIAEIFRNIAIAGIFNSMYNSDSADPQQLLSTEKSIKAVRTLLFFTTKEFDHSDEEIYIEMLSQIMSLLLPRNGTIVLKTPQINHHRPFFCLLLR